MKYKEWADRYRYETIVQKGEVDLIIADLAALESFCAGLKGMNDQQREHIDELEVERDTWRDGFNKVEAERDEGFVTMQADINRFTAKLEEVESERDAEYKRADLHADINRRSALALGKPTEGEGSSWSDIPECITALRDRVAALVEALRQIEHINSHEADCNQSGEFLDARDIARTAVAELEDAK